MRRLSLVAASGGHSSLRCAGLSLSRPLLLRSTGSRRADSVVVAHGPSCAVACGILPDQGLNPCPLHWQADSQPLRHQGSPSLFTLHKSVRLEDFVVCDIQCALDLKFSSETVCLCGRSLWELCPTCCNITMFGRNHLYSKIQLVSL